MKAVEEKHESYLLTSLDNLYLPQKNRCDVKPVMKARCLEYVPTQQFHVLPGSRMLHQKSIFLMQMKCSALEESIFPDTI